MSNFCSNIKIRDDIVDEIWEYEKKQYGENVERPPFVFAEINGSIYMKYDGECIYSGVSADNYHLQFVQKASYICPDKKYVVCECGCNAFYLFYGDYQISGVCTQCGNEQVLYDG